MANDANDLMLAMLRSISLQFQALDARTQVDYLANRYRLLGPAERRTFRELIGVVPEPAPEPIEAPWVAPADSNGDWYGIRAICPFHLSAPQVHGISDALGYALAQHIRGEHLSNPVVLRREPGMTVIEWDYDSTKSRSDDIGAHVVECFEDATRYAHEGSPVRKTDRAGAGTKGTRLVQPSGYTGSITWLVDS